MGRENVTLISNHWVKKCGNSWGGSGLLARFGFGSGQFARDETYHFVQSRIGPDLACLRIDNADGVHDLVAVQEAASLDQLPVR